MPVASKATTRLALTAVSMPADRRFLVFARDPVAVDLTGGFVFSSSLEMEIGFELSTSTSTCALSLRNLPRIGSSCACS